MQKLRQVGHGWAVVEPAMKTGKKYIKVLKIWGKFVF